MFGNKIDKRKREQLENVLMLFRVQLNISVPVTLASIPANCDQTEIKTVVNMSHIFVQTKKSVYLHKHTTIFLNKPNLGQEVKQMSGLVPTFVHTFFCVRSNK